MISMKKALLLAGAALLIGGPVLAENMMPPGGHHGPMGGRMFDKADANKDGKVTKAEADKITAERFKKISGGKSAISEAQFLAFDPPRHEHAGREDRKENAFKRLDWNSDGVLSLEEFSAVPHARFQRADRDGSGAVDCTPKDRMKMGDGMMEMRAGMPMGEDMPPPPQGDEAGAPPPPPPGHGFGHRGPGMRMMAMARHEACLNADADKNGMLTRAELDASLSSVYAAAVKGGAGMTPAQFDQVMANRKDDMKRAMFKRLDKNGDGKVTLAEFSERENRMFTAFDKNKDGVIDKSELPQRPGFRHHMFKGNLKPL